MKKTATQFELPEADCVFNLAVETTGDGERLQKELDAASKRRREIEELQEQQQPTLQ